MTFAALRHASRLAAVLLVMVSWAALPAPAARAQDAGAAAPAGDEDASVDALLNRLRLPVIRKIPARLRDTVERLLASGSPLARARLRAYLEDPSAPTEVVEQVALAVISDASATDLMDAVVERLRLEGGSTLARRCDEPLRRSASAPLAQALGRLARDGKRSTAFRVTAVRALGRTGHAGGLATLLTLWEDATAEPAVREAAQTAFRQVLPATPDLETARADVAALRDGASLTDLLRRRIADQEGVARSVVPSGTFEEEYARLAGVAVAALPIHDVLELLVLRAPLPAVRVAAVERVVAHDFGAAPASDAPRRTAGQTLLRALGPEQHEDVERVLVTGLLKLADALRGTVDEEGLTALMDRARVGGAASREVREAAIRVLGAVGDERTAGFLQEQFEALGDTDAELRLTFLGALDKLDVPMVTWLADRVRVERSIRLAEELVVMLSSVSDEVSVDVFVELLERRPGEREVGVRNAAVAALGVKWSQHGDPAACTALVERGLGDPAPRVRQTSAGWLKGGPKERLDEILPALERVVQRASEEPDVRVEATRAVLELAGDDALRHLGAAIEVDEVFDAFVAHRLVELDRELNVAAVLADARTLWAHEGAGRRERAVTLLRRVVAAREAPWESDEGRGRPREQLSRWLLARGSSEEALLLADELLKSARDDDPRARWEVLAARCARATGSDENLRRAVRLLERLSAGEAAPAELAARIRLELGDALLAVGDPAPALAALELVDAADPAFDEVDRARLPRLIEEARERTEAERARFEELVDRLGGPESEAAREALLALGYRAARRVRDGLEAAADDAARERLLVAAEAIARRTFPRGTGPEGLLVACGEAGRRMDEIIVAARRSAFR